MDTRDVVLALAAPDGGVVSRRRLLAAGADPGELADLRRAGELRVVRRGWYALHGARPAVVAAVRAGGAIACVSALEHRDSGIWIPPGIDRVHRRWPRHRQGANISCRAFRTLAPPLRAVDPLVPALLCAANCLDADMLVGVLDSTLRMPAPLTVADLREIFDGAPQWITRLLGLLDPESGSGTESVTRYRLHCAHMRVRSQVPVPDVGRVDLLVGDRLIIECDSEGYHGGDQRREDNRRDRKSTLHGYHVLRVDYRDVFFAWDAVFADVLELVRAGRHIGRPRS